MSAETDLTLRLLADPAGGYTVSVDEKPGCFTEGDTLTEALHNAAEAITAWDEAMAARVGEGEGR